MPSLVRIWHYFTSQSYIKLRTTFEGSRLIPPRKDRPISITLPEIQTAEDILKAVAAITQAIANGEISPSEGEAIARILDIHAKAIELHDFEKTLNELKDIT